MTEATVVCRIGVRFFLNTRFLRTDFAGVLLYALYPAQNNHGTFA